MAAGTKIITRKKVSDKELERRWKAVRSAMREKKIDFLIFQNTATCLAGYIKWFTDVSLTDNGYTATVIFPREDEMTTIFHGGWAPAEPRPSASEVRGVKKRISIPWIPTLAYAAPFIGEKVVEILEPYKNCCIGWVGMGIVSASLYKYLTEHLPSAAFKDATDMVDTIKAIKSDEEISLIRETCELEDKLVDFLIPLVRPGVVDHQIRHEVVRKCAELGSLDTNVFAMSTPSGVALKMHAGPRVLEKGDMFSILLETDSPSCFWGELSCSVCIGKAPQELLENFEIAKEAQKVAAETLKPGISTKTVWDATNAFLKSKGFAEELRINAHGQGYDMVERPGVVPQETMKIQPRMFFALHPEVKTPRALGWISSNFLLNENGKVELMHKSPQKIFVV
jgi:Xaa-Pro aminopeptidase